MHVLKQYFHTHLFLNQISAISHFTPPRFVHELRRCGDSCSSLSPLHAPLSLSHAYSVSLSLQAFFLLCCSSCCGTWWHARAALMHASSRAQVQANRLRAPAPSYAPGQKVWLLSKDLPLQVESKKFLGMWDFWKLTLLFIHVLFV